MTQFRTGRAFRLSLIGTALALTLSACGGSGSTRIAAIGDVPGDTASNGGGDGSGGSGNTGSGGSGGDGGTPTGGNTGGGSTGSGGGTTPLGGPILVTAGNAVMGLGDKHAGLAQTINGKLPLATPITGTVTAVLRKSGQTLIDLGNGRSAVLNKAGGAVGRLVTIDLGTGRVIGAPGATALIGVAALTPTQLAGVNVANPTGTASTGVLGKVGTIVTGVTGTTGGVLGSGGTTTPQTGVIPAVTGKTGTLVPAVTGLVGGVTGKPPKH